MTLGLVQARICFSRRSSPHVSHGVLAGLGLQLLADLRREQSQWGGAAAHRETCRGSSGSDGCRGQAFDPFGWKGAFKDTVEGLMDGRTAYVGPRKGSICRA